MVRKLLLFGLLAGAGWIALSALVLLHRIQPAPEPVGPPPENFPALEAVSFTTSDGWKLSGWQAPAAGKRSTVILLHQYKANRWSMVERARLLHSLGYGVLLYDARGCGESEGDMVSFGIHETKDLAAAVNFLHQQGVDSIGALGRSQGAATILLSELPFKAVVLESCYDDLRTAFRRRMETHLGFYIPGSDAALWWMAKRKIGFDDSEASPIRAAAKVPAPRLFVAGSRESRIPVEDSLKLHDAAAGSAQLWLVEGAAHEDLYRFVPKEYERRVVLFFTSFLP